MPIILDDDSECFVCGGPQIDLSTYKVILSEPKGIPSKEEEGDR